MKISWHYIKSEIMEWKKKVYTAKRKACFHSPAGVSSGSVISSFCKRPALRRKLNIEEAVLLSGRLALLYTGAEKTECQKRSLRYAKWAWTKHVPFGITTHKWLSNYWISLKCSFPSPARTYLHAYHIGCLGTQRAFCFCSHPITECLTEAT